MKKNEVRDQARLGFSRSFEFCLSSIRHRFFRSMVTLAVIVLAVAFLMNIMTESIIVSAVSQGVEQEFTRLYAADLFEQRITRNIPVPELAKELSRLKPEQSRWKELERWSKLEPAAFAHMAESARRQFELIRFFEGLDFGRRRKLAGGAEGDEIFDFLSPDAAREQVIAHLKLPEMASISVPGGIAAFDEFLKEWNEYGTRLVALRDSINTALDAAAAELKMPLDKALLDVATHGDAGQRQSKQAELLAILQKNGLETTPEAFAAVCEDRRKLATLRKFREYVSDPDFRIKWKNLKLQEDFSAEVLLRHYVDNATVREWVGTMADAMSKRRATPLPCTRDEMLALSATVRRQAHDAGRKIVTVADQELTKSAKQKEFLQFITRPEFAAAWGTLKTNEEFSAEALLWQYARSEEGREWLYATAKTASLKLPCSKDEVKGLADGYLTLVQRRGVKQMGTDSIAAAEKGRALLDYFGDPEFKQKWDDSGVSTDFSPAALLVFYSGTDVSPRVQTYVDRISRRISLRSTAPLPATEAELIEVARLEQERTKTRDLRTSLAAAGRSGEGMSKRTFWLIVVSFVVCVVGIANAMLMAVTERFREIATMKCLGALDGFVMTIFLIESGLQGLIGAIFGVVLGLLLAALRCGYAYGIYTFWNFPVGNVVENTLISTAAGMLLAMLAAVYPAWVASRMAPMEAMRVE